MIQRTPNKGATDVGYHNCGFNLLEDVGYVFLSLLEEAGVRVYHLYKFF